MSDLAADLIRRYDQLKGTRSVWESHWQELGQFIRPLRIGFTRHPVPGESLGRDLFDGTAGQAAEALAAGLWGMITNAANAWFALDIADGDLKRYPPVRAWLDDVTHRMHAQFAAGGGQFYARVFELYADLAVFGTAVFYSEDVVGEGMLHFSTRPLSECVIAEDRFGRVDTVIRRFEMTARQAVQRFGERVGATVRRAAAETPDRRFGFLHAVLPAEDVDGAGPAGSAGRAVASLYVDLQDKQVVRQGGFEEFPFQVPRWSTAAGEIYGRSPAMMALADTKMLNQMARASLEQAQKAVNPPLIAFDDGVYRPMRLYPGSVNYGAVNQDGQALVRPLLTGGRVELGLEMEEQRRRAIREAFYFSLLQLVGSPAMTATEVMARQEEKLRLLGPHLGRVQAEFLDPLIGRVFAVMRRARLLPPPPPDLAERALEVRYVSPLAQAQRAAEGQAILRAVESLVPLARLDPGVLENLDTDALARRLIEAWGAPQAILRDPAAVAAIRLERERAEAADQALDAAARTARAGRDGAAALESLAEAWTIGRDGAPGAAGTTA